MREREREYVCMYLCVCALEWLCVHMCVQQRKWGKGGGGDGAGLRGGEVEQGGGTGRRQLILSSVPALDGACRGLWHIL